MANIKHTIFGSLWCPITLMCVLAAHIDDLIIPVLMGAKLLTVRESVLI